MHNLRLYTFVNFYLSAIQQGIQTQHAAQELTNKYVYTLQWSEINHEASGLLRDWSLNHKTTVVLNGGDNENLDLIAHTIEESDGFGFPYACFFEDEKSLGGIMTSVAIVLPETFYDAKSWPSAIKNVELLTEYPKEQFGDAWFWGEKDIPSIVYTGEKANFLRLMKSCPLAR